MLLIIIEQYEESSEEEEEEEEEMSGDVQGEVSTKHIIIISYIKCFSS